MEAYGDGDDYKEPTLENAVFTGARAFKIGDYAIGGKAPEEKSEIIEVGRSW